MRVLLVEDDSFNRQKHRADAQTPKGLSWTLTDLGEDGLEIGKLYDYDIIMLDLMLPDIDGYEVLRRLRAARLKPRFSSSPASPSWITRSRASASAPTTT
jgi:two-component system cell cycle response regulator CtrA